MERNDWGPIAQQIRGAHAAAKAALAARGYEIIATLEYLAEKAHWQAERAGWSAGLEAWQSYVAGGEVPAISAEPPPIPDAQSPAEPSIDEEPPPPEAEDPWEEKLERRRERLRERSNRLRAESEAKAATASAIADMIPLGQPILVGHHSERRARRDAQRIRDGFGKAHELATRAAELERRAEAVGRGGVSSDDPGAVEKLRARIDRLVEERKLEVRANAKIRLEAAKLLTSGSGPLSQDEHVRIVHRVTVGSFAPLLDKLLSAAHAFPWLPQIGDGTQAEIRRLTARVEELEKRREEPEREPVEFSAGVVEDDRAANRVRVVFREKPSAVVIAELRSLGFVHSRAAGAWQRRRSPRAWANALRIVDLVDG